MMTIIEFDFSAKSERTVDVAALQDWRDRPLYWWIDLVPESADETRALLQQLGINDLVIDGVIGADEDGRYEVFENCVYFTVTEAAVQDGRLATVTADVVLGAKFLVTVHRHRVSFVDHMRRTYREDFLRFARTPGFLLYEMADHLVDCHRRAFKSFSASVEKVQLELFGEVDDAIFRRVSDLTSDLLAFRGLVRSSRELFHQLATRRSAFVSETTQPFLQNIAGTLERLGDDLLTERDTLNETLNLYMGMVSHRTNRVVNRLTVISMIFLPLSFLCGVYGMNLKMPEPEWDYGYALFWAIALCLTAGLLLMMRRHKWL
jgi:magnesium transporter